MANINILLLNSKDTLQSTTDFVSDSNTPVSYNVVAEENNTTDISVLYPEIYRNGALLLCAMKNQKGENKEYVIDTSTLDTDGAYHLSLPKEMTYAGNTILVFSAIIGDIVTKWLPIYIPIYQTHIDYKKVANVSDGVYQAAIDAIETVKKLLQKPAVIEDGGVEEVTIDSAKGNFVFHNIIGPTGPIGPIGPVGNGVKDTIIEYQAGTSGTTTPTGTWSATIPTVPQGQWLWTKTTLQFDDATKTPDEIIYSNAYQGIDGTNPFNCLYSHRYLVYVEGTIPSTTITIYTNLWITFNSTRTTLCTTVTELTDFLYEMFDGNNITTFSNDIYNLNIMQGGMQANKNTLNLLNAFYAGTAMWANFLHATNSGAIDWWQCAVSETYGVSTIQYSDIKQVVWR